MKTLRVLLTGFEPFGGENINPSWESVLRLPDEIGEYSLTKIQLPVVFCKSAEIVIEKAEEISADAIICVGLAGGRDAITPELVAINLRYGKIPDNNGYHPKDEPIDASGQAAYFSTLPVRKMAEAINYEGIPSRVSYSAGTYVCNDLLYKLAQLFENTFVLDFYNYAPIYDKSFKEKFYFYGHMNPMGYILTAKMVASYIDYIVRSHPTSFSQVGFIGTEFYDRKFGE